MPGFTSQQIANQAIMYIGDNQPLVSAGAPSFDSSAAGIILQEIYAPCVRTVGRKFGWDFARNQVSLTVSGNTAPFPWQFEYLYPGNGVQIWQLIPASGVDANNPLPQRWDIGNTVVTGVQTKVIWCNLAAAIANYNNAPSEATWDPLFQEAVVRLLASELAIAAAGKPDTAQSYLESFGGFDGLGESRPD